MKDQIQEIIDRETAAWNTKSVESLLTIFHPEMVWVWPSNPKLIDPITWECPQGKFDHGRWSKQYEAWFAKFDLIKNTRTTKQILITPEGDGAFAVVAIDTLWRSPSGEESHWFGRTGKTYAKTDQGWKMIAQVGVLDLR